MNNGGYKVFPKTMEIIREEEDFNKKTLSRCFFGYWGIQQKCKLADTEFYRETTKKMKTQELFKEILDKNRKNR